MRIIFFTSFLLFLFQTQCFAQQNIPSNNMLLGYQKFPTTITGHASDSAGNQYYVGTFKGELTINDKVISSGNGLEDAFWVKTDANGQLLNYKTYGSEQSDQSFSDGLVMGDSNHMLFGARIFEPIAFGSFNVAPYTSSSGSGAVTGCLVYTDTSGSVKWVRRTNLQNFRLFYADNILHVIGIVVANSPVKVEDIAVDSVNSLSVIHLMFDKNGKLLAEKKISPRKTGQSVNVFTLYNFSDKKLLLGLVCTGDSSFNINNKPVAIPSALGAYTFLIKTDTSYATVKAKLLNPLGNTLYPNGVNTLPVALSNDSIYTILTYDFLPPFTSFDGFTQSAQRSVLYVLDSSMTAKRQMVLSSTFAGNYQPAPVRRRLYFRNVLVKSGKFFFTGQFTGINESPWNIITVKDTALSVLPDLKLTVDQNGPSRSFIARCDLNGFNGIGKWYGDHHEYETIFLRETFFHNTKSDRLAFVHAQDNVWNPWVVDVSLNILRGSMRKNADMPEATQMIKYFDDGSRIVIGYAKGKTAFDSTGDFVTNTLRQDVFFVRLRPNNQVVWYKRFHSTLLSASARALEIKDGKAWFLINYVGTQNDSNFIRVGTDAYDVKVNASVLANIDTAGNLTVLNFSDPRIRYAYFTSFSFFSNGDIAALSNGSFVNLPNFPATTSPYVFRLKPGTGTLLEARKILGSSGIDNIKVDKNDQIYISGPVGSNVPYRLYLHDGTKYTDSLSLGSTPTALALLKMDWNHLKWQKRFSIAFSSRAELLLVNNKPVLFSPTTLNQSLSWDGQSIHNGFNSLSLSIVMLDSNGVMTRNKVLPTFQYNHARSGASGNIYLCGTTSQAFNIDTIQINYSGSTDGLGVVLDSNLNARRFFRVASPYSEGLLDMDIFQDSLVALAYIAQTNPQVYTSRMMAKSGDYEEDAYVGTITSRTNVITSINNPLPLFNDLTVSPNPVHSFNLTISANVTQSLSSTCMIYQNNGQFITGKTIFLTPGSKQYQILLPQSTSKGIYYVVISNKKWTTTRSFIVQ